MTSFKPHRDCQRVLAFFASLAVFAAQLSYSLPAAAQSLDRVDGCNFSISKGIDDGSLADRSSVSGWVSRDPCGDRSVEVSEREDVLVPESAEAEGHREPSSVAAPTEWNQLPFSRIGIGADVSPLGFGLKSAIVLTPDLDARLMGSAFFYNSGRFEVEGFDVSARLHLASASASLDWYPFNSIWRLSPGFMLLNDNRISAVLDIVPGTSFSLNGDNYYSANANAATGATPLGGSGTLGLHTNRPAVTLTGGFGKFIPRSNRHWSFPSEFGVAFTGAPSLNVNFTGTVCQDEAQTQCGNLGNPANAVTAEFNSDLQASLGKWRRSLNRVQVYPLFSYSVVYSFNIR